ncbi:MAG: Glu-tRNA(Gln) amidotransferase subunit GatE [Nanoarchaeota archaeon]|nr:Glu-tRNA(Gln) amidotransferase subunit GatE [Nanoarchaeota archaeon]
MSDKVLDYEKIGLKCGLEIHQQIDSHKLFCNCPSVLRKDEPDFSVCRKLHAVAGESGEVDASVSYQSGLGKEFVYQAYDTTCLVELDEEPPRELNEDALKTALHISLLLNCKIVPFVQIMRKTVIDGSNTSGFQRSVLIARDGWVETERGRVGISYVYLEEDAARKISDAERKESVYRLDRLGIPLVEIVTAPDVKTPEQAKEVALHIGDILRSCKVRRGIGTIRQDINVSIKGHPRVEIKGFQDPKTFVDVVNKEIERQLGDLESGKSDLVPEVRGANPDGSTKYLRPLPGSARMYPETDLPLLKISRDFINDAKKTLPKHGREIEKELEKTGLNKEMIKLLIKQDKVDEFKSLLNVLDQPMTVAKSLLVYGDELAKKKGGTLEEVGEISERINSSLDQILDAVKKEKISSGQIKEVMEKIASGVDVADALKLEMADVSDVEEEIVKMMKKKPGLSENAYMGLVMKEFSGQINGKEVREIIKKFLH